jgi:hypothetical protein
MLPEVNYHRRLRAFGIDNELNPFRDHLDSSLRGL